MPDYYELLSPPLRCALGLQLQRHGVDGVEVLVEQLREFELGLPQCNGYSLVSSWWRSVDSVLVVGDVHEGVEPGLGEDRHVCCLLGRQSEQLLSLGLGIQPSRVEVQHLHACGLWEEGLADC